MASREKKPLAPSKSKQKANNDSGLPSNEVKNKKGKSLPNIKQQQLTQEIFDTVATGSQVPVKPEASLPRRNALKNLKRKQNLRATKANLIKSKVTKKVTNRNIRRIAPDVKKGVKTKKIKQSDESTVDISSKFSENQTNNKYNESKGTETPSKSAKNNLRTKKIKSDIQNKEEASATSSVKVSPKLGRKGKTTESPDSLSKSAKTAKLTNLKKNNTKDNFIKVAEDNRDLHKSAKGRKSSGKESDCGSVKSNSSVEKFPKAILDDKNSIDLTIDEVIASSMLSDSETENQSVTEKTEGKVTRSKKMLVDENIACDIEIKKEPDTDDMKVTSDGEYTETDQGFHFQNAIQLRKRSKGGYIEQISQRSLRNGKQRQLSDSGNSADNDSKKRHRLNSDGTIISDNLMEHISDCNTNMDPCFADPSCNESQTASSKEDEVSKSFDEETDIGSEMENNNNSDRVDRTGETGPTLRSKTKAKTIENEATKDDDVKIEDARITSKCAEAQEDSKKLNNLDQARKDSILAKLTDKSKSRRSSLNIDMKKTVNSFYNSDKSDGNSKSQIDQMIENIKLNIAKSIESKIFGPEKGLGLSKNFDVPKIEEIVAPLSTESQKMGLEDNTDEDRSAVTKNEITSDSSENSVPKVADTAKEIEEKLVKSDIGEAETHSQNIQENRASDSDRINNVHNICESTCNISNNSTASCNSMDESEVESVGCSTASSASVNCDDNESKILDENKKIPTRRSPRISDKSLDVSNSDVRKSNRTPSKAISKLEDVSAEHVQKPTNEDTILEDATSRQLSDDNATTALVPAYPREVEERFTEKYAEAKELETSLSNSEESETLESISLEVERLVAEDQSAKSSLPNATNDTSLSKEIISDTMLSDKEPMIQHVNKQEASACSNESSMLESAANTINEIPSESHADSNLADANETLQENDASCKTAQSAKHSKTNNVSTTANCDSNSECSSVNSVPVRTCTPISWQNDETKNLDADNDCKELGKINDSISSLDENVSESNSESNKTDSSNKSPDNKDSEEQKPANEKKRALRARDKQKKQQSASRGREYVDGVKVKAEEAGVQKTQNSTLQSDTDKAPQSSSVLDETVVSEDSQKIEDTGDSLNSNESDDILESQSRTRRSRDIKRRKEEPPLSSSSKTKRVKREPRKSDQQNKEETLLDNEVAKINENNRSFLNKYDGAEVSPRTGRIIHEFLKEQTRLDKKGSNVRSKSENDLTIVGAKNCKSAKRQLSRNLSENHVSKQTADNIDILENECKSPKIPELVQKDSDETSTSGESSNSDMPKILETPEDKERKESILRTLGLESLEEAAKRMQNQQKIKKEQSSSGTSSGSLKTVIKVTQKEKDKDKRGSRSPLKMILKQQGRGDGEGDSPEFYTIQKEVRE